MENLVTYFSQPARQIRVNKMKRGGKGQDIEGKTRKVQDGGRQNAQ